MSRCDTFRIIIKRYQIYSDPVVWPSLVHDVHYIWCWFCLMNTTHTIFISHFNGKNVTIRPLYTQYTLVTYMSIGNGSLCSHLYIGKVPQHIFLHSDSLGCTVALQVQRKEKINDYRYSRERKKINIFSCTKDWSYYFIHYRKRNM